MPAKVRKTDGKYRVSTPHGVKAKGTTKKKAEAQQRLLNAIDHGFKPDRSQKRSTKGSAGANSGDLKRGYKKLGRF